LKPIPENQASTFIGEDMLNELFDIILDRKMNPLPGSYTNKLLDSSVDVVLQKVGEESVEVILAAKGQGNQRLVEEVSDLFYHTLVLLVRQGVSLQDIEAELRRRHTGSEAK
jgi:phosphoribosyl-ATP pyrophosphohydrolase